MKSKIKELITIDGSKVTRDDLCNIYKKERMLVFVGYDFITYLDSNGVADSYCYTSWAMDCVRKNCKNVKKFSELPKWYLRKYVEKVIYEE